MIVVEATGLPGVLTVGVEVFEDHRGQYVETYNRELYHRHGITAEFVQDDISVSSRNVLRGLHGDAVTWKLVSCLAGAIHLVVVDCREGSPGFGRWEAFALSGDNRRQVLVPPGHANGHLVLSERAIFHYKQSTYYDPGSQFSYRYDDPRFGIPWPVDAPILSRRDAGAGGTPGSAP